MPQAARIHIFKPRHSALKMYLFSLRISKKPQCERGTLLTGRSVNPTLINRTSLRASKRLLQQSHYDDWCKQSLLKRSDETFNQAMCNKAKRSGFEN